MQEVSFRLDGKIAFVTGGGRGIGKALALGLAQAGADVIVVANTKDEVTVAAREIAEMTGRNTLALCCDVSDPAKIETAVNQAMERFGHIDILINNAGIGFVKSVMDVTAEEWSHVMDTNLRSALLLSQRIGRQMIERGWGRIVNVASVSAGLTFGMLNAYGPSKAGLVNLTQMLGNDLGRHGVTVNSISPWFIKTAMTEEALKTEEFREFSTTRTPIGRIGNPEDLVAPVLFFCSESSGYVTGQNLFVDGGATTFGM
ncbi:glucose 1-dehydrogenase [Tumebacillus sp. ITR2]|uniref:Glucose 1-dehydrogenase n=1 Tax=Tumebacillus amylolyticus TaxID=2801339 RepID=A0ABS1JF22_9BACL|nr:glucose 1-dehydrogenase [Tumebacillus amylolyticus]MBL0388886.1 glucose 1-dehydrogenase [Tumebacillus amylolyticus]